MEKGPARGMKIKRVMTEGTVGFGGRVRSGGGVEVSYGTKHKVRGE